MWCSRGVSAAINGMVSWGNWISRPRRSRRDPGDSAVIRWTRIGRTVPEGRSRLLFAALFVDDGLERFGRERAPDDTVADPEARAISSVEAFLRAHPKVTHRDPALAAAVVVHAVEGVTHKLVVHGERDIDIEPFVEEIVALVAGYLASDG